MEMTKTVIVIENKVTEYEAIIIEHQVPAFEILDVMYRIAKEHKKVTMSDVLFILLVKNKENELGEIKVLEKQYFSSEQSLYKTPTMQNSKSHIIVEQGDEFIFELEELPN